MAHWVQYPPDFGTPGGTGTPGTPGGPGVTGETGPLGQSGPPGSPGALESVAQFVAPNYTIPDTYAGGVPNYITANTDWPEYAMNGAGGTAPSGGLSGWPREGAIQPPSVPEPPPESQSVDLS